MKQPKAAVLKISQEIRSVITIRMEVKAGWEQWFLLRADAHHDNKHCNHELERRHLHEAKALGAPVFDFGDLFCAMQGNWDKRKDQTQLREELRGNNYLDQLVDYNEAFYRPFADNIALLCPGNHETAMLKHHQTNLTERLAESLKSSRTDKRRPCVGGFSGWIRFVFNEPTGRGNTLRLKWHHGYGGDAPVTKGTIQTARMGVYLPDADFVVSGHTHNEWIFPITRERITNQGTLYKDRQWHIKVPGYKDEYADGYDGWHIERGGPPKPLGAAWLRFYLVNHEIRSEVKLAD